MILLGFIYWIFAGFMTKFSLGKETIDSNQLAPFVRQIGILALALPVVWTFYSIRKERDTASAWTTLHTIVSGILIAFVMFYLLGKSLTYGRDRGYFFNKGTSIDSIIKPASRNFHLFESLQKWHHPKIRNCEC